MNLALTPELALIARLPNNRLKVEALKRLPGSKPPIWKPSPDHEDGTPNTQRLAMESKADILGISGTAGWGKTDLALGIAALHHTHSVIFRRVFKNLRSIIERSREIYNPEGDKASSGRYNESLHRWVLSGGRMVEFEAMQYEGDKFNQRGRPRDLYVFDEATEFSKSQVEFTLGWMRTTKPGQRCRAILPFNPPTESVGTWVINYFLPWIAYLFPHKFQHPNPAKPGELRWDTTLDNGEGIGKPTGEQIVRDGKVYKPLSRSFLFGTLADNPHLKDTNYATILSSMPEPLRSQLLYGDFAADSKADPWQVIPTAWVKQAQRRWLEQEKPTMPLSGVGGDMVRGGKDNFALAKRYGHWFDEILKIPGVNVEDGPAAAGVIVNALGNEKQIGYINIDVIGVGSSPYDSLRAIPAYAEITVGVNVSERSDYVSMSKTDPPKPLFRMKNKRAEMYWRFREALDPEHGEDLALPPGNEIVADLCAAKYKVLAGGIIQIEPKDDIKKRIGRSPDEGEAVLLAYFNQQNTIEWEDVADLGTLANFESKWR